MNAENQTPESDAESAAATKRCCSCMGEIHVDASKCERCESFQDWRRHVNLGGMVLSLLVALTSVIAIAINQYNSLTRGSSMHSYAVHPARLTTDMPGEKRRSTPTSTRQPDADKPTHISVDILVANLGEHPGLIRGAVWREKENERRMDIFNREGESIFISSMPVGPNNSIQFAAKYPLSKLEDAPNDQKVEQLKASISENVWVEILNSNGAEETIPAEFPKKDEDLR